MAENWQATGFSQQQWTALQNLIRGASSTPGPIGPRGPQGPQGAQGAAGTGGGGGSSWKPEELGFFDPHLASSYGPGPMIRDGKDIWIRNVHLFVERIKDLMATKGAELVRQNLNTCLRGYALIWYTTQLTSLEREALRTMEPAADGKERWIAQLEKKFRPIHSDALDNLLKEKYRVSDARNHREPAEYMLNIMSHSKDADFHDVFNQLTFAYKGIDVELKQTLKAPTSDTTVEQFMDQLEERKSVWWELYGGRHQAHAGASSNNRPQPTGQYRSSTAPVGGYNTNNNPFQPRPGGYLPPYAGNSQSKNRAYPYQSNTGYPQRSQSAYGNGGGYQSYQSQTTTAPAGQRQITSGQPTTTSYPQNQSQRGSAYGSSDARSQSYNPFRPLNQGQGYQQGQQQQQRSPYPNQQQRPQYQNQQQQRPTYQGQPSNQQRPLYTNYNAGNRGYRPNAQFVYNEDEESENAYSAEPSEAPLEEEDHDRSAFYIESTADNDDHDQTRHDVDNPSAENSFAESFFTGQPVVQQIDRTCHHCNECFYSNNKLHKHLRARHSQPKLAKEQRQSPAEADIYLAGAKLPIIESNAPTAQQAPGYAFRAWRYATIKVSLDLAAAFINVCLDTGCTMSVMDRKLQALLLPNSKVHTTPSPVTVRGIGASQHVSSDYVIIDMWIPGQGPDGPVMAKITREVHLVDDLRANMLIGMDIQAAEGMVIDIPQRRLTLSSCPKFSTSIDVSSAGKRVERVIRSKQVVSLPPMSVTNVPIQVRGNSPLPEGRDYMFHPEASFDLGAEGGVFTHIVDANMSMVQVRNATSKTATIPRHAKLGRVMDYEEEGCYLASPEDAHLAVRPKKVVSRNPFKLALAGLTAAAVYFAGSTSPSMAPASADSIAGSELETVTSRGITIYGDSATRVRLEEVTDKFPELWVDKGQTVDIPEDEWMSIDTIPGAKVPTSKPYPLGQRDRDFIDKEFDKLHAEGKMEWTSEATPYGHPAFVVWRTIQLPGKEPEMKGRTVVDIRGLNRITEPDSYPMQQQSDITSAVQGCRYITTVDCSGFFYQWLVKMKDRPKLTVVSHRGSEHFNVAVMGFMNSPAYVQRKMDQLLRYYQLLGFTRAYVDDIVVFSQTLEEHIEHLTAVFSLFARLRIALKPTKAYIGFPSVTLLGQHVTAFGLTTASEKLEAILRLRFPHTLKDLEHYLGLTGWLRGYIERYAQKAEPLQRRKTNLLRASPSNKGHQRKVYSQRAILAQPSSEELAAYEALQAAFSSPTFLIHFDRGRILFIDVDASKEHGFGIVIYHAKNEAKYRDDPKLLMVRTDMEPILFLSKCLTDAESRYWPTELEVAGLVWTVRRVRHMIEASAYPVIVYTDHSATTGIVQQTKLSSSSVDKLNLRLVRASTYLSQFRLNVRHKPGAHHVVPDALSRLPAEGPKPPPAGSVLDDAYFATPQYAYATEPDTGGSPAPENAVSGIHVEMAPKFKKSIMEGYRKEESWSQILALITNKTKITVTRKNRAAGEGEVWQEVAKPHGSGIDFHYRDGLIYHQEGRDEDARERLCLPQALEGEIFSIAHDRSSHAGFHRCYQRIAETLYFLRLAAHLRVYIKKCHACQLNQTRRHLPYGALVPMEPTMLPFHTIAIDFVLALPDCRGMTCLLTLTDKATKALGLVPGKDTYSASDWAKLVLHWLLTADWGIPRGIISDRDPKFLSDFWRAIFKEMKTRLLTTTAYHAQGNGQSERTNQAVNIALRYFITENPDEEWLDALPSLQFGFNSAPNASTGIVPNKLKFGFAPRGLTALIGEEEQVTMPELDAARIVYRREAADAVSFANAQMKIRYDGKHKPLMLKAGDYAYLRLHHGYQLPSKPSKKFSNQYAGPFLVKKKIGDLAYELDLPATSRVHPVISVTMLEPADVSEDPYNRPKPDHPGPVETDHEDDAGADPRYEVERVVGRRQRTFGRTKVWQYLLRWKGWGPEHDQWKSESACGDCLELVETYERHHPRPAQPQRGPGRPRKA